MQTSLTPARKPDFVYDGRDLRYLQNIARNCQNVFAALMEPVKTYKLG